MDKFWRIIAVFILVFVLIGFYWTRNLVVAVNYPYAPAFYKISRLSGDIMLVVGKDSIRIKEADGILTKPENPAEAPSKMPTPAPSPSPAEKR